ncbi:SDR family oxidoreductase [Sinorhizobium garamanticum]|uniref:SDR family oxidoreductase n=1 Tax=Sinorhizobium garamanticum TaxID=680247 RepID=A0ABY8DLA9_9HYPH|nr:SDR family oxidoreductase [Sinorhizobium garamanticum]WEX91042.1 SDR family oxidoreductase [Sinorhizobium garamanticum]
MTKITDELEPQAALAFTQTDDAFVHTPQDSGVPGWARDFSVANRVVLITGAGQGIGRELARQFAAAGATPVVADLNLANAQQVRDEIIASGGNASALQVDIADAASVEALVKSVMAEHGRIDVLINNAAVFATLEKRHFEMIPLDEWDRVIRVNVTGPFLCARAVAPLMRAAGWGRIINVSSDAVPKGVRNYLHYVTSKSAIIGMTNAMARELGPDGINVNCIRPGPVATEVERAVNPTLDLRRLQLSQQCIQRGMVHTDLVGLMIFLATPAAGFITGQTIACDGGYTHSS